MDRLAVPAGAVPFPDQGPAPGVPAEPGTAGEAGGAGMSRHPRPRYRPRNMTFSEGLEGWLFLGSFTEHAS